jgi:hypothetical protein
MRRGVAGVLLCAVAVLVAAQGRSSGGAQPPPRVFVAISGQKSEIRTTIPITRHGAAKRRVVMSMGPAKLPALAAGDRLAVTSELQVTNDCNNQERRCAGHPYQFTPTVGSQLVLAPDNRAIDGRGVIALSRRRTIRCLQVHANRQHHCVIVFARAGHEIHAGSIPCLPDDCHVNFVLDANSRRARKGDKLVIGGNRPDGSIAQDKGRINAIRLRPGSQEPIPPSTTKHRVHKRLPLHLQPRVILSKRLRHPKRNEQLAVYAKYRTNISHLPYSTRVTSQLILARHRHSTSISGLAARTNGSHGEIDEANGSNCVHKRNPCPYRKVGVLRFRRDATNRSGDPIPLFVNLWVMTKPKLTTPRHGDRLRINHGAKLKVVRYPASMRG